MGRPTFWVIGCTLMSKLIFEIHCGTYYHVLWWSVVIHELNEYKIFFSQQCWYKVFIHLYLLVVVHANIPRCTYRAFSELVLSRYSCALFCEQGAWVWYPCFPSGLLFFSLLLQIACACTVDHPAGAAAVLSMKAWWPLVRNLVDKLQIFHSMRFTNTRRRSQFLRP